MTYRILPIFIIIATLSSCVSPKVVEEIKATTSANVFKKIRRLKRKHFTFSENIELKDKLSRLNSEITQLISDPLQEPLVAVNYNLS